MRIKPINLEPIKIEQKILDEWGDPSRCGNSAVWYAPNKRHDEIMLKLDSPIGWKAQKHNDGWYWVCDCPDCLKNGEDWAYIRCEKHDVCVECKIHRSKLDHIPWGHKKGFMCRPCSDQIKKTRLIEQMAIFEKEENDEYSFMHNSNIKCPHCGWEHEPDSDDYGNQDDECDFDCVLCENTFTKIISISVEFTTRKKEENDN